MTVALLLFLSKKHKKIQMKKTNTIPIIDFFVIDKILSSQQRFLFCKLNFKNKKI